MTVVSNLKNPHFWSYKPHILTDYTGFYKHRDVLKISNSDIGNGPQLSIMTYNVMALCGKNRYRNESGEYLENHRYIIIVNEIASYDADVVCLQEVSIDRLIKFRERLGKIGYSMELSRHNTVQTMAICYKSDYFEMVQYQVKNLYDVLNPNQEKTHRYHHSAMLMGLKFKDEFLKGHYKPTKQGLIIVNTHLIMGEWYREKRISQTAALMKSILDFSQTCREEFDIPTSYVFLGGDFNSSPTDSAYQSIVSKPFSYMSQPEPEHSKKAELEQLHNSFDFRAISLYSAGYKLVHPGNSMSQGLSGEPTFSFWGPNWQGLLDYIFVVCDWSGDDKTEVDTLEGLVEASNVRLLALLRIPMAYNMNGPIPKVGMYPSDHLCMMADVELI